MFHYKSCPTCQISPLELELVKLLSVLKCLPFVAYKLLLFVLVRLLEFYFYFRFML
jgi:hypothetical protein